MTVATAEPLPTEFHLAAKHRPLESFGWDWTVDP